MKICITSDIYLTMMEQINFLENPRPAVSGNVLVDDLDGVLHVGVDVDAGLDRGVGPLAQHLPGQPVQLLECVRGQGRGARRPLLLPSGLLCGLPLRLYRSISTV